MMIGIGSAFLSRGAPTEAPERRQIVTSQTSPLSRAPALASLIFYIVRNETRESHEIIAAGRPRPAERTEPLGPDDSFAIVGRLRGRAYWYVVWFDTRGAVEVVGASPHPSQDFRFPLDPYARAEPDKKDPPGTHLVLVVAGPLPPDEVERQLKKSLQGITSPPQLQRGERWHYPVAADDESDEPNIPTRSGKVTRTKDLLPSDYLVEIRNRLRGIPVHPLRAFFVSTKP